MTCCIVNMKNATPDYLLMVIHSFLKTALETLEQTGYFSVMQIPATTRLHHLIMSQASAHLERRLTREKSCLFWVFFLNGAVCTG